MLFRAIKMLVLQHETHWSSLSTQQQKNMNTRVWQHAQQCIMICFMYTFKTMQQCT